jgi:hypothetical protein
MRLLTLVFLLLASAADAEQQSPGNDRNKDGGPADRRNARQLQQLYDANGMPRSPSYGYQSSPRYGNPWPSRDYRSDRRRSPYFDSRPRERSYRCVEGWNGQLYCERHRGGW